MEDQEGVLCGCRREESISQALYSAPETGEVSPRHLKVMVDSCCCASSF